MSALKFLGGAGGIAAGIGALTLFQASIFNVDGGYRAVKFSRINGVLDTVYPEGTHFLIPWFEEAFLYDVRAKPRNIPSLTGTKGSFSIIDLDLQMVNITLRVLSKPDVSKLPEIHKFIGPDYEERVLPSIVNEVLKAVTAQFNASQLVTQREKVSRQIRERLMERATHFHIILDDVSLVNVHFGEEFARAVEAKQIAQQEAQRAAFIVERAFQEKQSIIVRAQGESEAAKLLGEAISKNPTFIQLRRIEAARDIAHQISKSSNKIFLSADSLMLNLENIIKPT